MPLDGVHAVSVPGGVAVYEALWRRYGTMDWPELWEPAIRLADEGIAITKYISARISKMIGADRGVFARSFMRDMR